MGLVAIIRLYAYLRKYLFVAVLCVFSAGTLAASLEQSLAVESTTQQAARASQQRVDKLSNQTEELLRQYQNMLQQADYQQAYNLELQKKLLEQDAEMVQLQQSIESIRLTRLHLLPLLRDMLGSLKQFVHLDLPFMQAQRLASIQSLETDLASSQISLAEKFRRLMELYQAEMDYSYNLGYYRENMQIEGVEKALEFLRIGRFAWYYQTPDGSQSAVWSEAEQDWQPLTSEFNSAIRQAMRVANKQLSPQLLNLPYSLQLKAPAAVTLKPVVGAAK